MDQPIPNPYRDGLPPAPPGPPEGEQHAFQRHAGLAFLDGLAQGAAVPAGVALALLAAGLAPAVAGGAALAAGLVAAVSLGMARHFGTLGAAERYAAERRREEEETHTYPERERWEVAAVLHRYGVKGDTLARAVEAIAADRKRWVDFMMRFELDLIEPRPMRAAQDGAAMAGGAALASLLPALPALLGGLGLAAVAASTAVGTLAAGWVQGQARGQVPAGGAARAVTLSVSAGAVGLAVGWFLLRG
jgi:hypothetical protein